MSQKHNESTLEALLKEKEKAERKLRYYADKEKILKHQEAQLTRKERTRRLCTRAGMLESFLRRPSDLTDDQVMKLLRIAFAHEPVNKALNEMLAEIERKETFTDEESS